jgi:hypothetical protein
LPHKKILYGGAWEMARNGRFRDSLGF